MKPRTMPRISALLLALGMAWGASAQEARFLYFEAQQPVTHAQLKMLVEPLLQLDPQAAVFHSDDMRIVQVRSTTPHPEGVYRALLEGQGIALKAGLRTPEELGINTPPAVPVYVATGDDAADAARYRAAVELWNAQHPGEPLSPAPIHRQ